MDINTRIQKGNKSFFGTDIYDVTHNTIYLKEVTTWKWKKQDYECLKGEYLEESVILASTSTQENDVNNTTVNSKNCFKGWVLQNIKKKKLMLAIYHGG